jgi:hypothetical protein
MSNPDHELAALQLIPPDSDMSNVRLESDRRPLMVRHTLSRSVMASQSGVGLSSLCGRTMLAVIKKGS